MCQVPQVYVATRSDSDYENPVNLTIRIQSYHACSNWEADQEQNRRSLFIARSTVVRTASYLYKKNLSGRSSSFKMDSNLNENDGHDGNQDLLPRKE